MRDRVQAEEIDVSVRKECEVCSLRTRDRQLMASRSEILMRLLEEQETHLRSMLTDNGRMQEMAMLVSALSR